MYLSTAPPCATMIREISPKAVPSSRFRRSAPYCIVRSVDPTMSTNRHVTSRRSSRIVVMAEVYGRVRPRPALTLAQWGRHANQDALARAIRASGPRPFAAPRRYIPRRARIIRIDPLGGHMSRVRVHNFTLSLDGFGTGEGQSLESPF